MNMNDWHHYKCVWRNCPIQLPAPVLLTESVVRWSPWNAEKDFSQNFFLKKRLPGIAGLKHMQDSEVRSKIALTKLIDATNVSASHGFLQPAVTLQMVTTENSS